MTLSVIHLTDWGGFLLTLNKKYKEKIPPHILEKLKGVTKNLEKSTQLKGLNIELPKLEKKERLHCLFCVKFVKSRGGLSNHLRAKHPQEYLRQLQFELTCFERRLQDILVRVPELPAIQDKRTVKINDKVVVSYTIESSFNLTIENDLDTLEQLQENREYLLKNREMFSEVMYNHLLNLLNHDLKNITRSVESRRKIKLNKINPFKFDAEVKQGSIEKYKGLIVKWKCKIGTLKWR